MPKDAIASRSPGNRDSLSPKSRGVFLKAAADFQTELFRVMAGFLPAVPRWELRREVSSLVFRDARRVQDLRMRCRELAAVGTTKHLSRAVPRLDLVEAICEAPDANAAFRAIFAVVKPALHGALNDYLQDDLRVFDAPSLPVVEANLEELDRQIAWANGQKELGADCPSDWLAHIEALSEGLASALEVGSAVSAEPVVKGRRIGSLPVMRSVIPDGFCEGHAKRPPADSEKYQDREVFHAHNFLMEIQAADSCASLLFEAPDMPWDFYFDTSRHMWDETRHCQFGEIKLRELGLDIREVGMSNIAYVVRQTLDPLDRYAALTT